MPPPDPVTTATLFSNRMSPFPPKVPLWRAVRAETSHRCEVLSTDRCGNNFGLEVLLEARQAHLPADAGLLVTAERRVGGVPDATVDVDGPTRSRAATLAARSGSPPNTVP